MSGPKTIDYAAYGLGQQSRDKEAAKLREKIDALHAENERLRSESANRLFHCQAVERERDEAREDARDQTLVIAELTHDCYVIAGERDEARSENERLRDQRNFAQRQVVGAERERDEARRLARHYRNTCLQSIPEDMLDPLPWETTPDA